MASLAAVDPEVHGLIKAEFNRQKHGIELIASENFTSQAVMECLGSCLTNKYSEGQAGQRYYGGNEYIDKLEVLCKERALAAFGLSAGEWGVNVQPYSGSPANFAAYTAVLQPHDRIMGLDLPSGGHLTHGYFTPKKKISATSIYFESLPYKVDPVTGLIDVNSLRELALLYRPAMIICGASAYPRIIDFARFRAIADEVGALLMCDMAHISGVVATGHHPSPFEHVDLVTSTSHKSLRGPRAGLIFYKHKNSSLPEDIGMRVDNAVFPGLQGGPHNHQVAALATQLKEVQTPEFKQYSQDVVDNCSHMAAELGKRGYKMATDGTDNHLILWDLRPLSLTGSKMEKICDAVGITVNRNCVAGDKSALTPGGVRIGSGAMTTRRCSREDFGMIAEFLHRTVQLGLEIQQSAGSKKLADFIAAFEGNAGIAALRAEVHEWAGTFDIPGEAP